MATKFYTTLMSLMLLSTLGATIHQTMSFESVFDSSQALTSNSLVVFDVDRVLIESEDAILRANNNPLLRMLKDKHTKNLTLERVLHLHSIIYLQSRSMLIDREVKPFIDSLKNRSIKVIALTATQIGGFGKLTSIQDWRLSDLESHGITFRESFPDVPPFSIIQLSLYGKSPVFKDGILFSANYPKGEVLRHFLETVSFVPDKVIFIDDILSNLQSVEHSLTKIGVSDVTGFHFLGADSIPNQVDLDIAELQFKTLIEKEEWLSDEAAYKLVAEKRAP